MVKRSTANGVSLLVGAMLGLAGITPALSQQAYFETPEAAAQALIDAAVADDAEALVEVLGPDAKELESGDPVQDANAKADFVESALESAGIEQDDDSGDDSAVLVVGDDDWPFPIPLLKEEQGWRFDTAAGLEELYTRRIGRNELYAIAVSEDYAQAQFDYAEEDRNGDGVHEFAGKLRSDEGKHNGLYWPTAEGEPESPVGALVADAAGEGYRRSEDGDPVPYHGYFYHMLDAQGANAPGGAKQFVKDGLMTEGFGLIAYPADYGNSGIMTFIVNQQGIVFEKDLGDKTAEIAASMTTYDPDSDWHPVVD